MGYQDLAAYQTCVERITAGWPAFRLVHRDRLRHGGETEKVAEGIIEDLFTSVLDWSKGDLDYQRGYADIVLSHHLLKYLVVEVKRPGSLVQSRSALQKALAQARRYADEQKIKRVAVSDGCIFYATDIKEGNLQDRLYVDMTAEIAPLELWWVSVHGIYRARGDTHSAWPMTPSWNHEQENLAEQYGELVHPKYGLPARCFAYVGDANNPRTWKLPFLRGDDEVDAKRLPKAIQALLNNYRGARVSGIPEVAIPNVLKRLARAAAAEGHLPPRNPNPARTYRQLVDVLQQLGIKLSELG